MFSVRYNVAAKCKLKSNANLCVHIVVVAAHCKAVEIIAQYVIIGVSQVDHKRRLLVLIKNLKLVADTQGDKRLLAV